ncbi:MAG: 16S rRNA (cytidine(1402)-2'-O)-methyltransferase [Hyphomicrobium sp.]
MEDLKAASVVQRVGADLASNLAAPLAPGLYLVATPIGNLGDMTLRALAVLARADLVCCEDTRHSGILLQHFAIPTPTRPYHEHNAAAERPRILAELAKGRRIALISDAGTPLVSDPGFKLVREAAAAGHPVVALPGPSSILAALVPSGLPTDAFFFAGFLPPKSAARRARVSELAAVPGSLVLFEAPQRVAETLADLAGLLGSRAAAVARELTKLHEEIARGPLDDLAVAFAARELRGEVVIVVGPALAVEVTDERIREHLDAALQIASLRDAAKAVADALGVPKARVYDLGLKLKRESGT